MTETREPPRLLIVLDAGTGAPERLAAALAAAPIASVVITPAPGTPLTAADAKDLVAASQNAGAAALIETDARLARTLKADGVHLPMSGAAETAYAEAREIVGRGPIVGIDTGSSRHDAMAVGEAGAEYVAFGLPSGKDRDVALDEQINLIEWWAEIFEIPCVALDVAGPDDARALAEAGADFVALHIPTGQSPAAVAEAVRAVAAVLADVAAAN